MTKKRSVKEMGSAQRASERARERGRSDGGEQDEGLCSLHAREICLLTVRICWCWCFWWPLAPFSLFAFQHLLCFFFVAEKIFGASKSVS